MGLFLLIFRSLVLVCWGVLCELVLALLHSSFLLGFRVFVCLLVWGFSSVHLGFSSLFASRDWGWLWLGVGYLLFGCF